MSDGDREQKPEERDLTAPRLRPGATWVCGHSVLGFACTTGPTANGKCGNHKKVCGKNAPATDGESPCSSCTLACHHRTNASGTHSPWKECEEAARSACIPVRSAWSFRNTLALNLALAASGILLCLMLFPQREAAFVPGSLSSKHAQILDGKLISARCSSCHPNSHTQSPLANALATQDDLCIRCHEAQLPQLHLQSPHDLTRDRLKQLTLESIIPSGMLTGVRTAPGATIDLEALQVTFRTEVIAQLNQAEQQTDCASCHIEHHGREHDLQAITDQRCQACHARRFASFSDGHPDFENYPAVQPRGIAFSHAAHMDKYFAKKNESFDCAKCHVDSNQRGGVGSVFRTLGFDVACARCHSEPINASAVDGWVMLQLPSIEASDTTSSDSKLADWPATAQFGYEGSIPLVMRSLLMSDQALESIMQQLPESGELKAIPNFATQKRLATTTIAEGTRALIRDVAATGHAAWRARLELVMQNALKEPLGPREQKLIDELCAGLPPDIFRQMELNWFSSNTPGIAVDSNKANRFELQTALVSAHQDDDLLIGGTSRKEQSPAAELSDNLLLGLPPATLNQSGEELTSPRRQQLTRLKGAVHVVQGGWYLDHETLSLRYMPRGHSDRTLAAWSEFATLIAAATEHKQLPKQVPGGCTQCHTLDRGTVLSPASQSSTWVAYSKPATARTLTKFDHTPHLTLPALVDCKYCHKLKLSNAERLASIVPASGANQLVSTSQTKTVECEFKTMHIEQCTACHRPNAASIGCTQCHNYHVTVEH